MLLNICIFSYLLLKVASHTGSNSSDIIIIDSGHAEAAYRSDIKLSEEVKAEHTAVKDEHTVSSSSTTTEYFVTDDNKSDVVFIPNEREVIRNDRDNIHDESVKIDDVIMGRKTINEVLSQKSVVIETESPKDILFISGKNNEYTEEPKRRQKELHDETRRSNANKNGGKIKSISLKLNCSDLECNNTFAAVCGGKTEHKLWKYRSFLNECYFRKVNCGFRHEENRYTQVAAENCVNIAAHYSKTPSLYIPSPEPLLKPKIPDPVRRSSARRSNPASLDTLRCPHPCPVQCTSDYQPECAVNLRGERRVFQNHCKLDYSSCATGLSWRRRPISECVGGRKADLHQNRAFVNWMQRVGIVDNKGRLVLT